LRVSDLKASDRQGRPRTAALRQKSFRVSCRLLFGLLSLVRAANDVYKTYL
jgi:hypothetical protein